MTLAEEKAKARYEHRLQVWRIVIEKGLLGLLLGAAVLGANIVVENFKSDLSRERFLLESRLTALQALRDSYGKLSERLWHVAHEQDRSRDKRLLKLYTDDLDNFMRLANKSSLLFSNSFHKAVEQHVWTHSAVAEQKVQVSREHWPYLSDVFDDFDHVTRAALWEETLGTKDVSPRPRFELEAWSFSQVNDRGPKAYFEANLERWKKLKGSH